jgi:hypothetical protein
VQVVLTLATTRQSLSRTLLADTGAANRRSAYQLILDEMDCLRCGGLLRSSVILHGAYSGSFPIYEIDVQLPALGFIQSLNAVGVPSLPRGFDGIACFRFLNRFTYGNFGAPDQFGLEC